VAERGVVAKHRHVEQADDLRIVGKLPPGGGAAAPPRRLEPLVDVAISV